METQLQRVSLLLTNTYKLAPSLCSTIILIDTTIRKGKISYLQFMNKNADSVSHS